MIAPPKKNYPVQTLIVPFLRKFTFYKVGQMYTSSLAFYKANWLSKLREAIYPLPLCDLAQSNIC